MVALDSGHPIIMSRHFARRIAGGAACSNSAGPANNAGATHLRRRRSLRHSSRTNPLRLLLWVPVLIEFPKFFRVGEYCSRLE